jgi:hypothetical protein
MSETSRMNGTKLGHWRAILPSIYSRQFCVLRSSDARFQMSHRRDGIQLNSSSIDDMKDVVHQGTPQTIAMC